MTDHRPVRHRRRVLSALRARLVIVAVSAAAAVAVGGISLAAVQGRAVEGETRAVEAETRAELARDNAEKVAGEIREACERDGEVAELLGDLCDVAEQVAEDPTEPLLPTEEQLRPLVQDAVADWLAIHPPAPGRAPTVDEITAVVRAELVRNPPAAGRTPTAEEIRPLVAEEVAAYISANPPLPGSPGADGSDGAAGRDGVDGRDGLDGRDGEDGEPGEPPHSWTYVHCGPAGLNCATYRCDRVDDFDPAEPRYTCTQV